MDKKTLKREYRETSRPMGVYRVRCRVNDRALVGSSTNVQAMLNRHMAQLKMGVHLNAALQEDWNRNGTDAFEFEVLDTLTPRDEPTYDPKAELLELEALWLERLTPFGERGYNRRPK